MQFLKPGFVQVCFGGGDSGGGGGGGSQAPSTRPQQRPSIMSVQRTPEGPVERVATRDMPRFGISAGDSSSEPSFSPFSLQGLTSTDPANVMRNIQGAERMAAAFPSGSDRDDTPAPPARTAPAAPAPTPVDDTPAPPSAPPAQTESGMTPAQEERVERAGQAAADRQRRLGLAQTIATSPSGLLSTGETTRRRRSLIGGGLIA